MFLEVAQRWVAIRRYSEKVREKIGAKGGGEGGVHPPAPSESTLLQLHSSMEAGGAGSASAAAAAASSSVAASAEVLVRFVSALPAYRVPADPIAVPASLNRVGLSQIIAHLLGAGA